MYFLDEHPRDTLPHQFGFSFAVFTHLQLKQEPTGQYDNSIFTVHGGSLGMRLVEGPRTGVI